MEALLTETSVALNVHILRTTIKNRLDVERVANYFNNEDEILRWTVDLYDWEKVLKVVATRALEIEEVIQLLKKAGYSGQELSD